MTPGREHFFSPLINDTYYLMYNRRKTTIEDREEGLHPSNVGQEEHPKNVFVGLPFFTGSSYASCVCRGSKTRQETT